MIDRTFIKAEKTENSLILTLIDRNGSEDCGVRALEETKEYLNEEDFASDDAMYEFFEEFLANSDLEWIDPEEIGALTDAPILGTKDEHGKVIEAYGYMDYAVKSILEDFDNYGKAVLQKG
jgi:hypothetical protein